MYDCVLYPVVLSLELPMLCRVLDIEPDSEDEEAILERRRQLRKAIEQKYEVLQPPQPATEPASMATSPARSEASSADSDIVGLQAAQ